MNAWRLALRQSAADPWGPSLLALLVAVLTVLVSVAPGVVADLDDAQLTHNVSGLSALRTDVNTRWSTTAGEIVGEDTWQPILEAADSIRRLQPDPLGSMLMPAQLLATSGPTTEWAPPESRYYQVSLQALIDPHLAEHVRFTAGEMPQLQRGEPPTEVAVLAEMAEAAGWDVGQQLGVEETHGGGEGPYVISGLFEPLDSDDERWQHNLLGETFAELFDPNLGVELPGGMFLSPQAATDRGAEVVVELWFPTTRELLGVNLDSLRAELTNMLAHSYAMPQPGFIPG